MKWRELPGAVRLLIAINAALLTVLTITSSAAIVGDQLFKNAILHALREHDTRLDAIDAMHGVPPPPHEHP